ncbi:MAG TPA: hypothetical protein PK745_11370 [bacterium]|nr:hypothetical protein [bacterium]
MTHNIGRSCGRRDVICRKLHETYIAKQFDNTDIWAGNMKLHAGKDILPSTLQRFFIDTTNPESGIEIRISAEIYIKGVTDAAPLLDGEIDAALWTDINKHGIVDKTGSHFPDFGYLVPMSVLRNPDGSPVVNGNNAVFISEPVRIEKTGAFSYTVQFSADDSELGDISKSWMCVNDIAHNNDGTLSVSPSRVLDCPSVMEICVRKYGARIENGKFVSGCFADVTRDIQNIPADIIYLLPIFETGTGDIFTGEDVRKGELGSVYAVKDFYRLDPAYAGDTREKNFAALASDGLITDSDISDVFKRGKPNDIENAADLKNIKTYAEALKILGEDAAAQLAARAALRELVNAAHLAGKLVVFDLVLMQTSRDSSLIKEHLDWYELDENGVPKIHSIAWLVYSDVALFRLKFNRPLQSYLSAVAPYWMKTCGLDGVRIDASQTVDRIFLKQIKNRINEARPDAIVIGETLCPLDEALDIPADIIYSLLVDNHVNVDRATPYYDLFETYHRMFPRGARALAYFENHDSDRASARWMKTFAEILDSNPATQELWSFIKVAKHNSYPEVLAALKSLQCSMINIFSGTADAVNFCCALENGTDFIETTRTDFEKETLLDFSKRDRGAGAMAHQAYMSLHKLKTGLSIIAEGSVFYLRENLSLGHDDRLFALIRHNAREAFVFAANLDPASRRSATFDVSFLSEKMPGISGINTVFDNYRAMGLCADAGVAEIKDDNLYMEIMPLGAVLSRITG